MRDKDSRLPVGVGLGVGVGFRVQGLRFRMGLLGFGVRGEGDGACVSEARIERAVAPEPAAVFEV